MAVEIPDGDGYGEKPLLILPKVAVILPVFPDVVDAI